MISYWRIAQRLWLAGLLFFSPGVSRALLSQESAAELSGFTPSEIFDVRDGGTIESDNAILKRLLHRCIEVSPRRMLRAAETTVGTSLNEICSNTHDYRFSAVAINGIARQFNSYPVTDENNEAFQGMELLSITDSRDNECLVILPRIVDANEPAALPTQWEAGRKIDQPVAFVGFFLGLRNFESSDNKAKSLAAPVDLQNKINPPVFVARRVAWYPDQISTRLGIDPSDLALAARGVDFNRLSQLGDRTGNGINANEAESFFQLLRAAAEFDFSQNPAPELKLESMLQAPESCLARPLTLRGHIRRVTEIAVEDVEIRQRLGIDKYFQLDLFVPLENRRIVIKPPSRNSIAGDASAEPDGQQDLVIENRFPVTVCTCRLPVAPAQINRDQVTIRGFFFKNWSFESELSIKHASGAQQLAPLVIAGEPEIIDMGPNYFGTALMGFAILVCLGAMTLAWFMRPSGHPGTRSQHPDQIDVPDLD